VFAGSDFHELRNGSGFLGQAYVVDHHGHDEGMRVREHGGENEGRAFRGCSVGWPANSLTARS